MHNAILRCLAKAVVKHGVKFLCNLTPGGAAVYDFAVDVMEDYRRDSREDELRDDLEALAQASSEQVQQQVADDVQAVAADQPPEVQQALSAYLAQVPAAIRRPLRRPSDPTGTTVPATLALSSPEDLMPFFPPRPPRFRPGDRPLPGVDWELVELVGIGGFGEVWKARHIHMRSKDPVAWKFCLDQEAAKELRNEAKKALENEVGVLDRVMQHGRHRGIVPLLNTYLSADPPCLEYEFVEGGDLAGLIQDLHGQEQMTLDFANRLFLDLVEIVAHPHSAAEPIVHGDLKPANILVHRGSEGNISLPNVLVSKGADGKISLRVTDFGIGGLAASQAARESRHSTRSTHELLTEAVRGAYTPLYASPEQMLRRKGEKADTRDDVHALGVIWYQLITGDLGMMSVPPDWREEVERRGLDGELVKLLASCIAGKAEKRPASAIVLAKHLRAALQCSTPAPMVAEPPVGNAGTMPQSPVIGALRSEKPRSQKKNRVILGCGLLLACSSAGVALIIGSGYISIQQVRKVREPDVTNSIGMKFAWCPPGKFRMGSPPGEENRRDDEARHTVTLTKGFYLGIHEVTQAQWRAVMSRNPSHFECDSFPVKNVTWEDCQAFCAKLGQMDGKRYRLPTEAEWEYACRAGTRTPFHFGEAINASYAANVNRKDQGTTSVGWSLANAWGLFDMHGNVWEWCQDWYGPYSINDIKDPQGINDGDARVLRGGSWNSGPHGCRAAYRYGLDPRRQGFDIGCRVVLCLD